MKRKVSIMLVTCLLLAMVTGCSGSQKNIPLTPSATQTQAPVVTAAPNNQGTTGTAGTPSDSFSKYLDMKGDAYDRISEKIKNNDKLSLSVGLAMLPITMVDLTLIPLTVIGLDKSSSTAALEMLGMSGVNVTQNGSVYTVTYKEKDGASVTQTCEYDPGTDSVRSSIKDSKGKQIMFFEYVRIGKGYVSQYYMLDEEKGDYSLITSFFDDSTIVAFGVASAKTQPASIFKNTGLTKDFVINKEAYFILENGKLSVLEKGKVTVY